MTHTQFGAQRVKDAVVDQFRERTGERPSVDRESPTLRINAHAARGAVTIAIDLSGDSLHRRGYRGGQGAAPLKENLAAAILIRSGWPAIAAAGGSFVDPMCGSGTLPIEAALIAADIAPGLLRDRFGFERWKQHDPIAWAEMRGAAEARRQLALLTPGRIRGFDRDPVSIRDAEANAARAGLDKLLFFQRCELEKLPAAPAPTGLVAVNPPYGERIGEADELRALYALLGERLRADYRGWEAAVFTGNPALGRELGINARRTHRMMNGPIECRLLRLSDRTRRVRSRTRTRATAGHRRRGGARAAGRADVRQPAARRTSTGFPAGQSGRRSPAFRVYDADMPEYAFAIDLYQSDPVGSAGRWLYVQEYAPPATVDKDRARARREEAISVLPEVTGMPPDAIYWRTRRPQKGKSQYEAIAEVDERVVVEEGGLKFLVNFTDYLDTGLFLDHRKTRARIRKLAKGKRFLNLFCYTGVATVQAAAGGASATTSIDMSRTYVEWAKRNLAINGLRGEHAFIQEDCLAWLAEGSGGPYDLIFLDPPTFSNSKRMDREFDVQRDHVDLIRATLKRLAPGGLLLFSTNFRKFKLDREALDGLDIRDITKGTVPFDFARDPKVHACFEIRRT